MTNTAMTALDQDLNRINATTVAQHSVPGTDATIVIFRLASRYDVTVYRRGRHIGSWGRSTEQEARECANEAWAYEVQLRDKPKF